MITEKDTEKLEDRFRKIFATKQELQDFRDEFNRTQKKNESSFAMIFQLFAEQRKEFNDLREHMDKRFDMMMDHMDGAYKMLSDQKQEHDVLSGIVSRHDRWIQKLGKRTSTPLEY